MSTFVLAIKNLTNSAPEIQRLALNNAMWIDGLSIDEGDHITAHGGAAGELTFEHGAQVSNSTLDVVYEPLRSGAHRGRVSVEFGAAIVNGVPQPLLGATASGSTLSTDVYLVTTAEVYAGFVIIRRRPQKTNATWPV